ESHPHQMANFDERLSLLIEEQPVFFITAIRPALAPSPAEFLHQVTAGCPIVDRVINKDIVQPKLRFVITNRLLGLETIGDVDVLKPVSVEIERAAAPGPAGAGYGIVESRLFEPSFGARQVKPVSKSHGGSS